MTDNEGLMNESGKKNYQRNISFQLPSVVWNVKCPPPLLTLEKSSEYKPNLNLNLPAFTFFSTSLTVSVVVKEFN